MNIQYVVYNGEVYVIEVNPRSSRTVPYISKVANVPMVDLATKVMLGEKLADLGYGTGLYPQGDYVAVKVPVFSFEKLHDVDIQLGPEMKSTGEVLGIARTFEEALYKGLVAAGYKMKKEGGVLISVKDGDKQEIIEVADRFERLGFTIYATAGTAKTLNSNMIAANVVRKIEEPSPNILDLFEENKIDYLISTNATGRKPAEHSVQMRRKAVEPVHCLSDCCGYCHGSDRVPAHGYNHQRCGPGGHHQDLMIPSHRKSRPRPGTAFFDGGGNRVRHAGKYCLPQVTRQPR